MKTVRAGRSNLDVRLGILRADQSSPGRRAGHKTFFDRVLVGKCASPSFILFDVFPYVPYPQGLCFVQILLMNFLLHLVLVSFFSFVQAFILHEHVSFVLFLEPLLCHLLCIDGFELD